MLKELKRVLTAVEITIGEMKEGHHVLPLTRLDALRSELIAFIEQAEAMPEGWRPIETAPRDSSRVLLFVPPYGATTGHYEISSDWGRRWACHSVLNKEAIPTHWQPLPQPPAKQGA